MNSVISGWKIDFEEQMLVPFEIDKERSFILEIYNENTVIALANFEYKDLFRATKYKLNLNLLPPEDQEDREAYQDCSVDI